MRQRILTFLLGLTVLIISGCGFHLRSITQVPRAIESLILDSPNPYGPLERAIREQLLLNGIIVLEDRDNKNVPSLRIVTTQESKNTISIFQSGKTAEYQMIITVQAQMLFPNHDPHSFLVKACQSFFDNPLIALAKDAEQEVIRQEMRDRIAQELVRKLLKQYTVTDATQRLNYPAPEKRTVTLYNDPSDVVQ